MLKLNLGCRDELLTGFVNIDLYHVREGVQNQDIRKLDYTDASCDEIVAHSVLEHLTDAEGAKALADWCRFLVVGGTISIITPDLDMAAHFIGRKMHDRAVGILYGDRSGRTEQIGQEHKSVYWREKLEELLLDNGMEIMEWGKWLDDIHVTAKKV